jgi:hypothetical protein
MNNEILVLFYPLSNYHPFCSFTIDKNGTDYLYIPTGISTEFRIVRNGEQERENSDKINVSQIDNHE